MRLVQQILTLAFLSIGIATQSQTNHLAPVTQESWYRVQSRDFVIYSSGPTQAVERLALGLEQFRLAYSKWAGAKAVASVPVVVMAFPNDRLFTPFKPVYEGKPRPVGGYFQRDFDENLIAVDLQNSRDGGFATIFHEYTHLLNRNTTRYWPLWLAEGVAEFYSTFTFENGEACLGKPAMNRIEYLRHFRLIPLEELFAVKHDSPRYNEKDLVGILYAESWALTHYLVMGPNAARKAQFKVFLDRLQQGMPAEKAFTSAFGVKMSVIQTELEDYLFRGDYKTICQTIVMTESEKPVRTPITRTEALYQLGNLFLHCQRFEESKTYFEAARSDLRSPRGSEGLGLLADRQNNFDAAIQRFEKALELHSTDWRTYYGYGHSLLANHEAEGKISKSMEYTIRTNMQHVIQVVPGFGDAYHVLARLEAIQNNGDLKKALEYQRTAIRLAPEETQYHVLEAEILIGLRDYGPARQVLTPLLAPGINPEIKAAAQKVLENLNEMGKGAAEIQGLAEADLPDFYQSVTLFEFVHDERQQRLQPGQHGARG